ncbi:fasciclin domain-containing protein [Balneolaceae bacterium YR4-1]|uniref:Fasciclin domain-containing protein n=1 Tax=Halalkalibaculum roseum TaxID=2709311 RepID=A0A6M1T1A1_9BACT|nr:fasciclin domain-containing protein [Halalkalibaculum roseum]NGP75845.1 fasciclin domain-containing protein [Halalkalibaculum roseum]
MRVIHSILLFAGLLFAISACNDVTNTDAVENDSWLQETKAKGNAMSGPNSEEDSILEIAASSEDFSTLAAAVEFAGLQDALNGKRQFTVFAPTNEAFDALLAELDLTAEELLVEENKELVTNILLYHVAPGSRDAEDVTESDQVNTLLKKFITVQEDDGAFLVGNEENGFAQIIATDIFASNGVVHAIDSVMLPPTGKNAGDGEDDDEGEDEDREDLDTILEIASSSEDFSTLAAAVEFAGLSEALGGKRQYTVFAPNNEAFDALLAELGLTAEELLVEENKELVTNILLYHVAPGARDAEDVTESDQVNTLLEKYISVQEDDGAFFVGNEENGFAQIIATDIFASNGVIHAIDNVMLPPSDKNDGDEGDDDDEDDGDDD